MLRISREESRPESITVFIKIFVIAKVLLHFWFSILEAVREHFLVGLTGVQNDLILEEVGHTLLESEGVVGNVSELKVFHEGTFAKMEIHVANSSTMSREMLVSSYVNKELWS